MFGRQHLTLPLSQPEPSQTKPTGDPKHTGNAHRGLAGLDSGEKGKNSGGKFSGNVKQFIEVTSMTHI